MILHQLNVSPELTGFFRVCHLYRVFIFICLNWSRCRFDQSRGRLGCKAVLHLIWHSRTGRWGTLSCCIYHVSSGRVFCNLGWNIGIQGTVRCTEKVTVMKTVVTEVCFSLSSAFNVAKICRKCKVSYRQDLLVNNTQIWNRLGKDPERRGITVLLGTHFLLVSSRNLNFTNWSKCSLTGALINTHICQMAEACFIKNWHREMCWWTADWHLT